VTAEARETLIAMADGDGRALLNLVEQVAPETVPSTRPRSPRGSPAARRSSTSPATPITT
jgi:replication-associated recombination protein RarA